MVGDSSDDLNREDDVRSPEEWLDQQAAQRGISREEVFQQLLSSYWALNEMSELINESQQGNPHVYETQTNSSRRQQPSQEPAASERDTGRNTVEEDDETTAEIQDLRDRITNLLDELETNAERTTQLSSEIQSVREQLAELEREIADIEHKSDSRHAEVTDELETVRTEVSAKRSKLHSRLETEFGNLEKILRYLLNTSDELQEQLNAHQYESRSNIDNIETTITRREKQDKVLQRILQDASEIGTQSGDCEVCGNEIDLSLLTQPHCPQCDAQLEGVEEETKWGLFSKSIVKAETGNSTNAISNTNRENKTTVSDTSDPSRGSRQTETTDMAAEDTGTRRGHRDDQLQEQAGSPDDTSNTETPDLQFELPSDPFAEPEAETADENEGDTLTDLDGLIDEFESSSDGGK